MRLAGATINLRQNKSRCAALNAFTMLSNLSRSIVLEAIIRCTSTTFFRGGIRSLGSWHLANFPPFGLQKINSKHYATPNLSIISKTNSFVLSRLQRFVTLKILKADASKHSRELLVLLHLSKSDQCHPGRDHVVQLLDHFEHEGPNGLHLCLVLPVMVSDGEAMTIRERPRYASYIREVSRQILLGLDSLHCRCLIHGGMYSWDQAHI